MPLAHRGKSFNQSTPLGKLMYERGLSARLVCEGTHIHPRVLTELLAGRKQISHTQMAALCTFLKVPPGALIKRREERKEQAS